MRLQCSFCGELFTEIDMQEHKGHMNQCPHPLYSEDRPLQCFTCGSVESSLFSGSQRSRAKDGLPARCSDCINNNRQLLRWQPPISYSCVLWSAGQQLMEAITTPNLALADQLLSTHSNSISNHHRQLNVHRLGAIWDTEGRPWPETDRRQPFSPLRMVVFRISDCLLTMEGLKSYRRIAELLIAHKADAVDASDYICDRYGRQPEVQTTDSQTTDSAIDLEAAFRAVINVIECAAKCVRSE